MKTARDIVAGALDRLFEDGLPFPIVQTQEEYAQRLQAHAGFLLRSLSEAGFGICRNRRNVVDFIGQRFGLLSVSTEERSTPGRRRWLCLCDCGGQIVATTGELRSGCVSSCGCVSPEKRRTSTLRHGDNRAGKRSKEYKIWAGMKARCHNEKDAAYPGYGGRGITVCERWRNSFECFLKDMGRAPDGHSIDRIDNDGGYEPTNCRWATQAQQARNTRRTIRVNGMALIDACEAAGVSYSAAQARLSRGATIEQAMSPLKGGAYRAMMAAAMISAAGAGE